MHHLFLTGVVLLVIVLLLRRKVSMAIVMPVGTVLLAILYRIHPIDAFHSIIRGLTSPKSLEMTITLALTMVMEYRLRTSGMLRRMVASLSTAIPNKRVVLAALPAVIGMLPSPGGAVFSAPMVAEASDNTHASPEQKALINYWYRHIWEYVSPLYPGVILASGLTGLSTQTLFWTHLPFSIAVIAIGALYCFSKIHSDKTHETIQTRMKAFSSFLYTSAPIFFSLLLVVASNISPAVALCFGVFLLLIMHRPSLRDLTDIIIHSLSLKALVMVVGIMVFQDMLQVTGAVAGIADFFSQSGLPVVFIILVVPLFAGLLTGLTVGYIGITFPLLIPLMGTGGSLIWLEALAFASGFMGVMLSPVHLCLVLTREYFQADTAIVFKRLIPPSLAVLTAALIPYLLYR